MFVLLCLTSFSWYNAVKIIHVVASGRIASFFMVEWYSSVYVYVLMYIYHNFSIHSSKGRHLSCFHILAAIRYNAAMNMRVQVSF